MYEANQSIRRLNMQIFFCCIALTISSSFACEPRSPNAMTMRFGVINKGPGVLTRIQADRPVAVLVNWCVDSAELGSSFGSATSNKIVPIGSCESMVVSVGKNQQKDIIVNYNHTVNTDGRDGFGQLKYCVSIMHSSSQD